MQVTALDHLVLTVRDLDKTVQFYGQVLGMQVEEFRATDQSLRMALKFGNQKINLHVAGSEFDPKSANPTPGSADLCFLTETDLPRWIEHFGHHQVTIIDGPIRRTGATGPINSLYVRDPDGNLIEVSVLG